MSRFNVVLIFIQYSRANVVIDAVTLEEAQEKAEEIGAGEVDYWNPFDGQVAVESVCPATDAPSRGSKGVGGTEEAQDDPSR